MRNLISTIHFKFGLILGLLILAALLVTQVGYAGKNDPRSLREFPCGLEGKKSGLGSDLYTTASHSVISASGKSTVTCRFQYSGTDLPRRAKIVRNFDCAVFGDYYSDPPLILKTTQSHLVITPSGNVVLTCRLNNVNAQSAAAFAATDVVATGALGR